MGEGGVTPTDMEFWNQLRLCYVRTILCLLDVNQVLYELVLTLGKKELEHSHMCGCASAAAEETRKPRWLSETRIKSRMKATV